MPPSSRRSVLVVRYPPRPPPPQETEEGTCRGRRCLVPCTFVERQEGGDSEEDQKLFISMQLFFGAVTSLPDEKPLSPTDGGDTSIRGRRFATGRGCGKGCQEERGQSRWGKGRAGLMICLIVLCVVHRIIFGSTRDANQICDSYFTEMYKVQFPRNNFC